MVALFLSVLTFFSTAMGGLFALRHRNRLYLVMGLSAGILVSAALLDLLPEALEIAQPQGAAAVERVFIFCALGFLLYYSLDFFVHLGAAGHEERHGSERHPAEPAARSPETPAAHSHQPDVGAQYVAARYGHSHGHHHPTTFGSIAALGLTVHSFLDGFAIGGGFQTSATMGWLVALAVLAHDFGDGVTTVGVVLGSKGGWRASLGWLLADAVAPVLGCTLALTIPISESLIAVLLSFFSGSFLFIGAAHLLPEAEHEGKAIWLYGAVVIGFVFVGLIRHFFQM
ncbi:MAG TPA: ZIP family metal transporter [Pirellulales bacterium]|jgi:ZIP family zinc transporter|nr:ZIP family metal transporter [Pirellulales bacterium]